MGFWNDRHRVKHRRPYINSNAGATALSHDHAIPAATSYLYLGEYTGNGSLAYYVAVTTDNVDVKYVRIWAKETSATASTVIESTSLMVDNSGNGVAYNIKTGATILDAITVVEAKGFFVDDAGGDSFPNANGIVYEYMALAVPA
tara:strand:- start:64 stop:498 length:435 start_codon:yes stop_codon:yes gene_type:complete